MPTRQMRHHPSPSFIIALTVVSLFFFGGLCPKASGELSGAVSDFSLLDVNQYSSSYGTTISPRDYLGHVSGWYFSHTTCGYCRTQFQYLQFLQFDLDSNYPDLGIQIVGVNEVGFEVGNSSIPGPTYGTSNAWIQDRDDNGDLLSDVWADMQVTFRDVVILDEDNVKIGRFNLTTNDLSIFSNYEKLRQMFITAATTAGGDFDLDGDVDGADFLRWQRGESPHPMSQSDLTDWKTNFDSVAPLSVNSAVVPEPSSTVLLIVLAASVFPRRRRWAI